MRFEWKRLMTLAMAIVMVFTMLPLDALAANEKTKSGSVNFSAMFQNDDEPTQQSDGSYQVTVGGTETLPGKPNSNRRCDYEQNWTSSDRDVATVNGNGVVKGVKPGTVTITHTYCKKNSNHWWWEHEEDDETFTVTVVSAGPSITVTPASTTMTTMGQTQEMKAAVTGFEDYIVTWTSSNPELVSISAEGVATVRSGSSEAQTVTITATATSQDEETEGNWLSDTAEITVQFQSYPLYYYALIPGMDSEDTSTGAGDRNWFGLGIASISGVADPTTLTVGTRPTSYTIDASSPSLALYPVIHYEGNDYTYAAAGSENANKEGYYTLAPMRVTVANGANAGNNGYNKPTKNEYTYHYDHTIVLNEKNVYTVNFMVMDPGYDTFAALENYVQRVDSGTSEGSLRKPTAMPNESYDEITYRFDGWYTDSDCTQRAEFNGTITANTNYYGKYVPTQARYTVEYYYDGVKDGNKTVTGGPLDIDARVETYTPKPVTGYTFQKVENLPLTITANESANVIKVYYVKNTNLSYTVNYLEKGTNKELATTKTENGQTFGTEVTENAIDIAGYNKVDPTSKTITIGVEGNVINFYYTARTDLSYTVNYLEKDTNKVLTTAKTENGQTFGTEVTENAIDIAGYNKVDPTSKTITIGVEGNVINFYYTARTDLSYTVNYLEKDTNKVLADAKTVNNQTFGTVIKSQNEVIGITGYSFDSADKAELRIGTEAKTNVINLYYTINRYTVTWKNHNGDVLEVDTNVPYGTKPSYGGATPTRAATDRYTFTFKGWDKKIVLVTENVTYTATYNAYERPAGPEEPPVKPPVNPFRPPKPTDPTLPEGPTTPPTQPGTEILDIQDNEVPLAEAVIPDEEVPLANAPGAWALINLLLTILTALISLILMLGYLGKKDKTAADEDGNPILDENGEETLAYTLKKKGFWRLFSLIPAIVAIVVFILTEDMRLPMVLVDKWTILMLIIALVQVVDAILCRKKKETPEEQPVNV